MGHITGRPNKPLSIGRYRPRLRCRQAQVSRLNTPMPSRERVQGSGTTLKSRFPPLVEIEASSPLIVPLRLFPRLPCIELRSQ